MPSFMPRYTAQSNNRPPLPTIAVVDAILLENEVALRLAIREIDSMRTRYNVVDRPRATQQREEGLR